MTNEIQNTTAFDQGTMFELDMDQMENVSGGVSQDTAIATNMGIVAIGVGIAVAGATAPAWFPIAMMGVGVASVVSYAME